MFGIKKGNQHALRTRGWKIYSYGVNCWYYMRLGKNGKISRLKLYFDGSITPIK